MADIVQDDICRYYGDTKPINGLSAVTDRRTAQDAVRKLGHPDLATNLWQAIRYPHSAVLRGIIGRKVCNIS